MVQCARVDESTNSVLEVIESKTLKWCKKHLEGTWVKNETDKSVSVGYTYHPDENKFSSPRVFESWVLDDNFIWQPPTPLPSNDKKYLWDEDTQTWIEKQ